MVMSERSSLSQVSYTHLKFLYIYVVIILTPFLHCNNFVCSGCFGGCRTKLSKIPFVSAIC